MSGNYDKTENRLRRKNAAVPIAESFRRENPLLPKVLYVDATETKPEIESKSKKKFITFTEARLKAEYSGNRLARPLNTKHIERPAQDNEIFDAITGKPAQIVDLFGGVAEWTTTKYRAITVDNSRRKPQDSYVLAGYGDPDKSWLDSDA